MICLMQQSLLLVSGVVSVTGLRMNDVSWSLDMVGEAKMTHKVAWFHIPKCGTSFGTTLAHFANRELPPDAHILSGNALECGQAVPEVCFTNMYPIEQYFKGLLWEKNGNWGNHNAIDEGTLFHFQGSFFGMFRKPQDRVFSSWKYFTNGEDYVSYWEKIKGVATKMLAGQEYGLECSSHHFSCNQKLIPDTSKALARLDAFKFIGLTTEWDLSICLFHAMFGGDCSQTEFLNMRPTTSDIIVNPFENMIDPYDSPVFAKAEKIFWKNIHQFGVSRETCEKQFCPNVKNVFTLAGEINMHSNLNNSFHWPGRYAYNDEYEEVTL